ncbi:MAG: hypothetical protein WA154_10990 [Moraxellaceae bacterium]
MSTLTEDAADLRRRELEVRAAKAMADDMGHGYSARCMAYARAAVRVMGESQALAEAGGAVGTVKHWNVGGSGEHVSVEWSFGAPPHGMKLYTHPDSGRVAELEAQLAEIREELADACERIDDLSCAGGRLAMRLTESRELEGRMRGVLEAFDKAARESGSIIGFAGKAVELITHARAALAAEQEKK